MPISRFINLLLFLEKNSFGILSNQLNNRSKKLMNLPLSDRQISGRKKINALSLMVLIRNLNP